ncbi:MAG: acyl transferase [Bacteroidetes bacterium]|nr:MAG: acyl transferase [Bacteroidota bacterium]
MIFSQTIGAIQSEDRFNQLALEAFRYQLQRNQVYIDFTEALGIHASSVNHYTRIPFLPIEFFKTREVYAAEEYPAITFRSSGTTGMQRSVHAVADASLYRSSLLEGFRLFYGEPSHYMICALTPSLRENPDSSLAYMIDSWISAGAQPGSGFFLNVPERLAELLQSAVGSGQWAVPSSKLPTANCQLPTVLVIGLTYALLDFAEQHPMPLPGAIIMETGGMKGRRQELVREEVHTILKQAFLVETVHSEYGMSELLSQAYSQGNGRFCAPPWMKVLIRDPNDPFTWNRNGKTGGISIIDLANWYSCPFIATKDLGRLHEDGSFEILGRFDHSDLRGCNLMMSD